MTMLLPHIAIDFDGTITRHQLKYRALSSGLVNLGWHVTVLTAGAGELPREDRPREIARRLASIGFGHGTHYSLIACVEGGEKGFWCRDHNVDFAIDDETNRLKDITSRSPRTVCLQSWPINP